MGEHFGGETWTQDDVGHEWDGVPDCQGGCSREFVQDGHTTADVRHDLVCEVEDVFHTFLQSPVLVVVIDPETTHLKHF